MTAAYDGPAPGTPEANALLAERARKLATPVAVAPVGRIDVLEFELARERYGIESRYVQAVFVLKECALLPGAQPPIHGVTSWRGDLLTLLELRSTLGLAINALHDLARVVVLGVNGRPAFGVLTDMVHSIVPVDMNALHPLPEGTGSHRKYLRGVTGDALLILDPDQLLRHIEPESAPLE